MLNDLLTAWRKRAEMFQAHGADSSAKLLEHVADELEAHLRASEGESVNLTEGAALSGFTADHLGRLIREGKLQNVGRPGAPRILVVDLPRKVGCAPGDRGDTVLPFKRKKGGTARGLEKAVERRRVRVERGGDAS